MLTTRLLPLALACGLAAPSAFAQPKKACGLAKGDDLKTVQQLKPWLKSAFENIPDYSFRLQFIDRLKDNFPRLYRDLLPLRAETLEEIPFEAIKYSGDTEIALAFYDLQKADPNAAEDFRNRMLRRMANEPHSREIAEGITEIQNLKVLAQYFQDGSENPTAYLVYDLAIAYERLQPRTGLSPKETPVKVEAYIDWVRQNYGDKSPPDDVLSQEPPCDRGCDDWVAPSDAEVALSVENKSQVDNLYRQGYRCTMEPFACEAPTDATEPAFSGETMQKIWDWGLKFVLDSPTDSSEALQAAIALSTHPELMQSSDIDRMLISERENQVPHEFVEWLNMNAPKGLPGKIFEGLFAAGHTEDDHSSILAGKEWDLSGGLKRCEGKQDCIDALLAQVAQEDSILDRLEIFEHAALNALDGPMFLVTEAVELYEKHAPEEDSETVWRMASAVEGIVSAWHTGNCPSAFDYFSLVTSIHDPALSTVVAAEMLRDLSTKGAYEVAPGEEVPPPDYSPEAAKNRDPDEPD